MFSAQIFSCALFKFRIDIAVRFDLCTHYAASILRPAAYLFICRGPPRRAVPLHLQQAHGRHHLGHAGPPHDRQSREPPGPVRVQPPPAGPVSGTLQRADLRGPPDRGRLGGLRGGARPPREPRQIHEDAEREVLRRTQTQRN